MRFADVTMDGERYRAVTMDSQRGSEEHEYLCDTTYWFRYEPLTWRVLDAETGLLLCDKIIDCQTFSDVSYDKDVSAPDEEIANFVFYNDAQHTHYANDYTVSDIRAWLNSTFLTTAFTSQERHDIATTDLDNTAYPKKDGEGDPYDFDCSATEDKIYLLSYKDMLNTQYGFDENAQIEDDNRTAEYTDYALIQGLFTMDLSTSTWVLRTAGLYSQSVCYVGRYGELYAEGSAYEGIDGIRPALNSIAILNAQESKVSGESSQKTEASDTTTTKTTSSTQAEATTKATETTTAHATTKNVTTTTKPATTTSTTKLVTTTAAKPATTTKAGKGVYKVSLSGDSGVADVQGAGSYRAGDTVTVTATLLIGYTFRQWASSDPALLPNGTTQTYKFTMPAGNVSLKVITYIKPKVTLHAGVGVYSVTGGGSYAIGQSVTVSAVMEQGYEFSGWTSDSSGFGSSQLSYTFIMPEHGVTLTATGTAKTFTVSVKAGTGISGVSGSGQYKVGDIVTINATVQPNYSFSGWSGHTINYPNSVSTTFVMPGKDITIFASAKENPKYTISVARGDNGITSVSGGGSFYAGTSVTVSCQVATGYVFNGWNSSNTNLLKGSISQSYSFKMPAGNVTLTARAKSNQYSLSLSRGTGIQSVSGGGKYIAGSSVTVSCTPSKGYEFKEWVSSSSKLKGSLAQSYTFSMPEANVSLTAKAVKIQYMMAAQKDADIRTEGDLSLNLNRKPAAAYAQISSECIPNLWTSNDITPCVAESKKFTSPKNKCI